MRVGAPDANHAGIIQSSPKASGMDTLWRAASSSRPACVWGHCLQPGLHWQLGESHYQYNAIIRGNRLSSTVHCSAAGRRFLPVQLLSHDSRGSGVDAPQVSLIAYDSPVLAKNCHLILFDELKTTAAGAHGNSDELPSVPGEGYNPVHRAVFDGDVHLRPLWFRSSFLTALQVVHARPNRNTPATTAVVPAWPQELELAIAPALTMVLRWLLSTIYLAQRNENTAGSGALHYHRCWKCCFPPLALTHVVHYGLSARSYWAVWTTAA